MGNGRKRAFILISVLFTLVVLSTSLWAILGGSQVDVGPTRILKYLQAPAPSLAEHEDSLARNLPMGGGVGLAYRVNGAYYDVPYVPSDTSIIMDYNAPFGSWYDRTNRHITVLQYIQDSTTIIYTAECDGIPFSTAIVDEDSRTTMGFIPIRSSPPIRSASVMNYWSKVMFLLFVKVSIILTPFLPIVLYRLNNLWIKSGGI